MSRFKRWLQRLFHSVRFGVISAAVIFLILTMYALWYVSAGMFPEFPYAKNAYVELGQSFLQRQLSLQEEPDPRLQALDDPYDPTQRDMPYRWDASYYNGKYYLYWGPVPAAIFSFVEGVTQAAPPGSLVAILSYIGIAFSLLVLWLRLWSVFFRDALSISVGLFLVFSLVNLPVLFLLGRPDIYETSIIAGQFFLVFGLLSWVLYVTGKREAIWLVSAGLGWGLAIGSRYNLGISVAIYLVSAWIWFRSEAHGSGFWKKIFSLYAPVLLCLLALGLYNFVRFDDVFEIGFRYQLSIPEIQRDTFSFSYFLSNFYVYLFYPMTTSGTFPFVIATLPLGASFDEIVAGLLPSVPGMWLMLLFIPLFWLSNRTTPIKPAIKQITTMAAAGGVAQFLFLMTFFFAAMRYMADFYLAFVFVISILIWQLDEILREKSVQRSLLWLITVVLIVWTAGIGLFGAFDIPPQSFYYANPELYTSLAEYWNGLTIK